MPTLKSCIILWCPTLYFPAHFKTHLLLTLNFTMSHFVTYRKLQHTVHYLCWNFGTSTPCLALYFSAHITKWTFALMKSHLGLMKTNFVFESTIQKETVIVRLDLSPDIHHPLSTAHFRIHLFLILHFHCLFILYSKLQHFITYTDNLISLQHASFCNLKFTSQPKQIWTSLLRVSLCIPEHTS